ncbi:WD40 repeat-like protein [Athelia psychrophila]|uniref:ASTRA-associated protein 1 n=1 Tax=Athelia psychrophila TaxID=1759441 RepID=A0A166ULN1_9AGAM|nr:WD40 repeat-like protein [Fibularhizoctonia sp. CBS 109695]
MPSASAPPPPSPSHILRSHTTSLSALAFSPDNERIYSGDASGLVIITSTRSLRAIASWKAHTEGVLGIEEWGNRVVTHGRDNKLHVWDRVSEPTASASIRAGGFATATASASALLNPTLFCSMDVNSLNYCRFSLLPTPMSSSKSNDALIALPNLIESSNADIWTLPSCQRVHAAIGKDRSLSIAEEILSSDGRGSAKTGLIMSMHLSCDSPIESQPSASNSSTQLKLLCAYESGAVTQWRFSSTTKVTSVEGIGWEATWTVKLHVETVMAMAVTRDNSLALTVSADHLVGRYDLINACKSDVGANKACVPHRTKHPGNACISIRADGKVCAIGGWDGKIRLYSTKTLKSLGTLAYHKEGCQAVAFACSLREAAAPVESEEDTDENDMGAVEKEVRSRWLVAGGKDSRVSIWEMISFRDDKG